MPIETDEARLERLAEMGQELADGDGVARLLVNERHAPFAHAEASRLAYLVRADCADEWELKNACRRIEPQQGTES